MDSIDAVQLLSARSALGEQISLDRLRLLESFLALELELKGALRGLNFLR